MISTLSAEILGNSGSMDKVYEPPSNQSDESLIRDIVNGNEESFNNLISRYRDKMYNIAFRVTDSHSDAEDVVQEACICLYKKAHTFRQSSGDGLVSGY